MWLMSLDRVQDGAFQAHIGQPALLTHLRWPSDLLVGQITLTVRHADGRQTKPHGRIVGPSCIQLFCQLGPGDEIYVTIEGLDGPVPSCSIELSPPHAHDCKNEPEVY